MPPKPNLSISAEPGPDGKFYLWVSGYPQPFAVFNTIEDALEAISVTAEIFDEPAKVHGSADAWKRSTASPPSWRGSPKVCNATSWAINATP